MVHAGPGYDVVYNGRYADMQYTAHAYGGIISLLGSLSSNLYGTLLLNGANHLVVVVGITILVHFHPHQVTVTQDQLGANKGLMNLSTQIVKWYAVN